jgi:PAS domain S-box-containing protein
MKTLERIRQEEKLTGIFFQKASAFFLVLDMTGRIVAINEYGCKVLGHSENDVINMNWFENFVPESMRMEAFARFAQVQSCETPVLNSKGEEIDISWKHTLHEENGQTIVLCTGIDISARKKQEKLLNAQHQSIQNLNVELEEKVKIRTSVLEEAMGKLEEANNALLRSQKLLTTAIHYFPEGVIGVMNKDMRYIFADGQELKAIGLHERGVNERVFDNVHPALSTATEEKLKWVFGGSHLSYEIDLDNKTYLINAVPIPNHETEINEIMVVISNITERKKLETKLFKSIEKERELVAMKSKFVTMASHEFRTPLTTILSSTFLLQNYSGPEYENKKATHLNKIKQAVNNMTELLNDFILLGKLDERKVRVTPTVIDLHHFREELEPELETLKKEGQTLRWELADDEMALKTDKQLLRSVLVNLVGNALKYSAEGTEVKITFKTTAHRMKIQVIDRGMGIPSEEQPHIFKRFFRAQNAMNIGGSGLGLNIVRKHVKLMKGKIEFESKLNEGTIFTVMLPLENKLQETSLKNIL